MVDLLSACRASSMSMFKHGAASLYKEGRKKRKVGKGIIVVDPPGMELRGNPGNQEYNPS